MANTAAMRVADILYLATAEKVLYRVAMQLPIPPQRPLQIRNGIKGLNWSCMQLLIPPQPPLQIILQR